MIPDAGEGPGGLRFDPAVVEEALDDLEPGEADGEGGEPEDDEEDE